MRLPNKQRGPIDTGPNLIPVVNIAMVVLIVFMIGATFVGPEHYLVSNLPISQQSAGAVAPPEDFVPDEPLDIYVSAPAPDRFIARAGHIQTSDIATLESQLRLMRQQHNANGNTTGQIQVIIRPGRDVKYKFLVAVYEAALAAEFEKVAFATAQ